MKKVYLSLAVLICLGISINAFAQNAAISGIVTDSNSALIPGVEVTATNVATGIVTTRISNETGAYNFPGLQPGTYKLTASLPGFRTATFNDVTLSQAQEIRLNFTLSVGAVQTVLEVTTDANVTLATTTASVGNVLPTHEVNTLPLATRNVQDLYSTMAGVIIGSAGSSNFAGQRSASVNTTRDGLIQGDSRYLDVTGAQIATFSSPDLVEEVQIVTGSIDAESGRGNAQIRLQTRSGTNAFHGALFYSNQNSGLNAQNWFNNLAGAAPTYTNRNQYGGRLGGPILKNKAFFFGLFDGQRFLQKNTGFVGAVLTPQARLGNFRYFPGVLNGNALSATPTVDLNGNLVSSLNAANMKTFNLFTDVADPNRKGPDTTGWLNNEFAHMPLPNDYTIGDGLNTAGFRWPQRLEGSAGVAGTPLFTGPSTNRDNYNARIDYQLGDADKFSFIMSQEKDWGFNTQGGITSWPGGFNGLSEFYPKTYSVSWVKTISHKIVNEFRAGYKITKNDQWGAIQKGCCFNGHGLYDADSTGAAAMALFPHVNGYPVLVPQVNFGEFNPYNNSATRAGSNPTIQYTDGLSWISGKHSFKVGGERVSNWSNGWNMTAIEMPQLSLGDGNAPVQGINGTRFPGLLGADSTRATSILNDLTASVATLTQTFIINSPTATDWKDFNQDFRKISNFRQNDWAAFFKDNWTVSKNLTLNLGIRYDYFGVGYDQNGLTPISKGGQAGIFGISGTNFNAWRAPGASGGSLTQVQLVSKKSPNPSIPWYPADKNNFSPSVGFSWSIPNVGRQTVLRGGYGINYAGAFTGVDMDFQFGTVPGRISTQTLSPSTYLNLASLKLPLVPSSQPLAVIPLTDRTQQFTQWADDKVVPYVQNWNLSIQREVAKNTTLEANYTANKSTKLSQPMELNEPNIFASWNGSESFLNAFNITRAGGQSKLFDAMLNGIKLGTLPAVNGTTQTGSAALRAFGSTNSIVANGNVGALAQFFNRSTAGTGVAGGLIRTNGFPENFLYVNPQFNSALLWGNNSNENYHSMQLQVTRRLTSGFTAQATYLWSKALGDAPNGNSQRASITLDPVNRKLNHGRLSYDRTQMFRSHGTWDLPFGAKRHFLQNAPTWADRLIGGWQMSGILSWNSGAPLQLTSPATVVGVTSNLSVPDVVGAFPKSTGTVHVAKGFVEYFQGLSGKVTSTAFLGSDPNQLASRVVNQDIVDSSGNILLTTPTPGRAGNAGINSIVGPGRLGLDMAMTKSIPFGEKKSFTIRANAINILNRPQWGNPIVNINSNSFGRITSSTGERNITLDARIDF